jgi:hypothetical protein
MSRLNLKITDEETVRLMEEELKYREGLPHISILWVFVGLLIIVLGIGILSLFSPLII